jgi:hypothetical protein
VRALFGTDAVLLVLALMQPPTSLRQANHLCISRPFLLSIGASTYCAKLHKQAEHATLFVYFRRVQCMSAVADLVRSIAAQPRNAVVAMDPFDQRASRVAQLIVSTITVEL